MNDLISRNALRDALYAEDAVTMRGVAIINQFPSVDAVPVVRCKDCKYLMFSDFYGECRKGYMGIVSPDDFCSYGERKDNG